jgi:hypothetical protein
MDVTFTRAKQALLSATHLSHPTVGAELSVVADASATHVGGGGVPAATATWQKGLAAPGLLLKEAGGGPAEILCF